MLYHWHGVRSRWDPGPLLKDATIILHSPNIQFRPLVSTAFRPRPLSSSPCTKVVFFIYLCTNSFRTNKLNRFDPETILLYPSLTSFSERPPSRLATILLHIFKKLGLVQLTESSDGKLAATTNLTILNVFLVRLGPMSEKRLVQTLIATQVCLLGKFNV